MYGNYIELKIGADPGGPQGPGPLLTLCFDAPKLKIFGPVFHFSKIFLPHFARHIIFMICCF